MLPQVEMLERLRTLCMHDERIVAAMLYGSFTTSEGDVFSDIDVALFFADEMLASVDEREWVSQIAPVELFFVNEFGNRAVIFDNLVRAEFHFERASNMAAVESWKGNAYFPSPANAVLVDRSGRLAQHLAALSGPASDRDNPENAQFVVNSFVNWLLFGANVLARGEFARSHEILTPIHQQLLRMVRLLEGATGHWVAPAKALEQEISAVSYARLSLCVATLDPESLRSAYHSCWGWGNELMEVLAQRHGVTLPEALLQKLDRRLEDKLTGTDTRPHRRLAGTREADRCGSRSDCSGL